MCPWLRQFYRALKISEGSLGDTESRFGSQHSFWSQEAPHYTCLSAAAHSLLLPPQGCPPFYKITTNRTCKLIYELTNMYRNKYYHITIISKIHFVHHTSFIMTNHHSENVFFKYFMYSRLLTFLEHLSLRAQCCAIPILCEK